MHPVWSGHLGEERVEVRTWAQQASGADLAPGASRGVGGVEPVLVPKRDLFTN